MSLLTEPVTTEPMAEPLGWCDACEEPHPIGSFTRIDGWWVFPYPDIEWFNDWGEQPATIFTTITPERVGAWLCPCGCIQREGPRAYTGDVDDYE